MLGPARVLRGTGPSVAVVDFGSNMDHEPGDTTDPSTLDPVGAPGSWSPEFEQTRHKPGDALTRPRELIVACVPMRSNVNVSQIARTAGACAVDRMILCGNTRLIDKIARDGADTLTIESRRSLAPVLKKLSADGYRLVGLEQTTQSHNLHEYRFERRTVLVVGNERLGIEPDVLALLDDVVEIPVWGMPHSYNAATATNMALYEFCRQYPAG